MRRATYLVTATSIALLAVALLIPQTAYSERLIGALFGLWGASYVCVGALISARRPGNSVGWLMLGSGSLMCAGVAIGQYAGYALLGNPTLPLGEEAAWVTTWVWYPALSGIALLLLVFPLGHVDGPVRTWTARVCVAAGLVTPVAQALVPGPMDGFGNLANPFAVESLAGLMHAALTIGGAGLFTAFVVGLGSLVLRLRRARGNERQQLKWVVYAMVLLALGFLVNWLPLGLDSSLFGLLAVVAGLLSVPFSVALAILRHRLYDIDVVINRTLVYGALTAVLAVTYLVLVLGLRAVLGPVTGQSDLAVAGSTLAVAALFRPLRNRIQTVVDRRFYRSHYDAELTLEDFAAQLRNELDLESLGSDLREVVSSTMQPAHVTLWLRSEEASR